MRLINKLIFSIIVLCFFGVVAEITVRFLWQDLPENYLSIYKYPFQASDSSKKTRFEHIPNWRGYATGVRLKFNEAGLRDIPEQAYIDKNLILYSGDSIFFGYGLVEDFTITGLLNSKLAAFPEWRHLNNGVCGYNFTQIIESLKYYNDRYENIRYNFISFIHNDLENLFQDNADTDEIYPSVKSAYFVHPNKNTFIYRLMNLLMPDDLTSERYIHKIGVRKILLRYSKLYLASALTLKRISFALAASEKPYYYLYPELKIADKIIYTPLQNTAANFKKYADLNNIKYAVTILLDHIIEGAAILKITEIFERLNLNFYNTAMFMPEKKEYAKNFILGWDSHFNRSGSMHTAGQLKKIIDSENIIQPEKSEYKKEYAVKLKEYTEKQKQIAELNNRQFINNIYAPANEIKFNNQFDIEKYFIYGYWDAFPIYKEKVSARLDGVWTTKFGSICFSSSKKIETLKIYFEYYNFSDKDNIFVNNKPVDFNIKTKNDGNVLYIYPREQKQYDDTYFYELYFELDKFFKDDNNKIFGMFIKKIEME